MFYLIVCSTAVVCINGYKVGYILGLDRFVLLVIAGGILLLRELSDGYLLVGFDGSCFGKLLACVGITRN